MDSVNNFLNEYIFTQGVESRVGQYGNDIVDLINKFIRIIIAFMIVYLIITKLPDHGDKDHTMYFNLLLLISIFLLLIYIQKNWRGYYLMDFLGAGNYDPDCAQDIDDPKPEVGGKRCPVSLEDNGLLLIDSIGVLKYIYKFAIISYVGGGFNKKGLHNILETCIYGNPIIIGKNYKFFSEAKDLIRLKGVFSIKNSKEFNAIVNEILLSEKKRNEIKIINRKFINDNLVSINEIIKSIKNE